MDTQRKFHNRKNLKRSAPGDTIIRVLMTQLGGTHAQKLIAT
jgi:hypothetical protein